MDRARWEASAWAQFALPRSSRIRRRKCLLLRRAFGMTAFDMETANRFGAPYIAVIGNNSAMNQIRYGQITKYGEERGSVANLLGDVPFGKFAEMLGGYGEEVRDPAMIAPALRRARESVAKSGRSAVINVWVDPREYAPGTKAQTMYK
jgi:acetolactate synthase-1/2/3 large subunit